MKKQTKYLFVGATVGVLIFLGGYLMSIYENSHLLSLVEKCKTESTNAQKEPLHEWEKAPLLCDPNELAKLGGNNVGVQEQIVESLSKSGRIFNNAKVFALFIFLLFCLPYAWYGLHPL